MNPLAAIIAIFASLKVDLAARFNQALAGRPPLEAVEGANVANGLLREFDWAKERLERMGTELSATLAAASALVPGFEFKPGEDIEVAASRLSVAMMEDSAAKAISTALAAKEILRKEDYETALENALLAARQDERGIVEVEFRAKVDEIKILAERRTALIEKVGTVAAAALADADLLAEDHEDRIAKIATRVTDLAAAGITPEAKPKGFASLIACGLDESGQSEFTARLETITESAGSVTLTASTAAAKPATQTGVIPSGSENQKKKTVI